MDCSFGICAGHNSCQNVNLIIDSIEKQKIPKYEVIVIGNIKLSRKNTVVLNIENDNDFSKPMGKKLGIKKNIIVNKSSYENLIFLHDYICFDDNWYDGYLEFGNNWFVCMNPIKNLDGSRYRDWTLWEYPLVEGHHPLQKLIPYNITHLSKVMYISGAYWVAKKEVMIDCPLSEELDYEDVEWSNRIRNKYQFSINAKSSVTLLKNAERVWDEVDAVVAERLKSYVPPNIPRTNKQIIGDINQAGW